MGKFIRLLEKGAGATATTQIDLEELKKEFETEQFNSMTLLNTHLTVPIKLLLDGKEVAYVPANNGVFEIKPEHLLKYSFVAVINGTATALTTELKFIVGLIGED